MSQQRVRTGIKRLDYILKGGFLRNGVYSLFGPPGGGKTILANQSCFNHVKLDGGRCVYLTLLVESHTKMLQHLRSLEFFDPGVVGDALYYISGYQVLKESGLAGLLNLIRETVVARKPTLFVIDGLENTEQYAATAQEYKEFLHELQAFTALAGCTSLLCAVAHHNDRVSAHHTIVDGIVELSDQLIGPRAVRELTVHKFRGSDYLRGRHEVEITAKGIQIHPRTEIQFDKPASDAREERVRMPFGVAELDAMLHGGLPSGSTTALLGAPGTGKTLLGLHFLLDAARRGQKGIYFGFYEPPPRLCEKAAQVGLDLEPYIKQGLIDLIWQPPLEHYMDSLAEQLLEKLQRDDASPGRTRLFIDGIEGFRAASIYNDRIPRFLSAFTNQLRMLDVTTVITEELPLFQSDVTMPNPQLGNVVESILLLRYVELNSQLYRLLSIMKMRESVYDTNIREFRINSGGIEISASFNSAEAILSGQPRLRASKAEAKSAARRGTAKPRGKRR